MSRLSPRRTVILAGLLGLSVAVLVPGQVASAAPAGPAVVADLPADCADVVDQAASSAGVTAESVYGCAQPDPSTAAAAAASISATQCSQRTWTVTRTTACVIRTGRLFILEVQTKVVKGILYYSYRNEAVLDPKSNTWTQAVSFTFDLARSWGYAGTTISGDAACSGACTTVSGSFGPGSVTAPGARTGTATFRTTVSAPGQVDFATPTWKHWFSNVNWLPPRSNSVSTPIAAKLRCDNKLGGITSVGCVFPDSRPTLAVDAINATYHRHIQLALQYNMRGVLTRLQDPGLQEQNRRTACPKEPRPDSYSCDEYPFASTYEGAFTGNHPFGRTFDGCQVDWLKTRTFNDGGLGYSACLIVKSDNTNGGVELGQFYNNQRVIDRDKFNVTVR